MKLFSALATSLCLIGATKAAAIAAAASACPTPVSGKVPAPSVAAGFESRVVTTELTYPRGIVFDSVGHLLVVDRGVGVKALTLHDDGGTCVTVSSTKLVINNANLNHGIDILAGGTTLLVSSPGAVFAYGYDPVTASVTTPARTLIDGMANTDHDTRTITHSKLKPGTIIINRGSESNIDTLAMQKSSGHAQVKAFDISALDTSQPFDTMNFTTSGTLLAWGVRNDVGIAEAPDGGIWTVENSVDNIERDGVQFNQDNPGEKLNYMGTLINNQSPNQGSNFGYPECFATWNVKEVPEPGNLKTGVQFTIDPSVISDKGCQTKRTAPRLVFDAHMAPLDIKFGGLGNAAFVSFHGSYDRPAPQVGYKVSGIAFADGQPKKPSTSNSALIDLVKNAKPSVCPTNCFRPVGLAFDTHERLYFSSDATGEIYVIRAT